MGVGVFCPSCCYSWGGCGFSPGANLLKLVAEGVRGLCYWLYEGEYKMLVRLINLVGTGELTFFGRLFGCLIAYVRFGCWAVAFGAAANLIDT